MPFIFMMIFSLIGCDKDSSRLDSDSIIRLNLRMVNYISDTENTKNMTNFALNIHLYEDVVNQQTGDTRNQHVGVSSKGVFTLTLDDSSYDLLDYYHPGTVLYGDGYYRVDLFDIDDEISDITVNFSLDGEIYSTRLELPSAMLVP